MKTSNVYIGTILECTDYKLCITDQIGDSLYAKKVYDAKIKKERVILIKTKTGGYIDIDNLKLIDILRLKFNLGGETSLADDMMTRVNGNDDLRNTPSFKGQLFVEANSLNPYSDLIANNNISILQLKKLRKK